MTSPNALRYRIPTDNRTDNHQNRGLGRHVNHDPRSRRYPFTAPRSAVLNPVFHERHVPIFDQGQLGSCEGNATLGLLATGPYWSALGATWQANGPASGVNAGRYPWSEAGAVNLYSDITAHDDFDGQYPPTDTGSDGLSAANWLTALGIIPGYRHAFSLADTLAALQQFPQLMGTEWLDRMFSPDSYGRITVAGPVDGGHAWILDEYVPAGKPTLSTGDVLSPSEAYVGGTTSWGLSFGARGRFFLTTKSLGTLLSADGDAIVMTPTSAPAPQPTPAPEAVTAQHVADAVRQKLTDLGL